MMSAAIITGIIIHEPVVEVAVYLVAFVEIMILRRFQSESRGWGTEGRRYKLDSSALADVKVT